MPVSPAIKVKVHVNNSRDEAENSATYPHMAVPDNDIPILPLSSHSAGGSTMPTLPGPSKIKLLPGLESQPHVYLGSDINKDQVCMMNVQNPTIPVALQRAPTRLDQA